MDEEDSERQKKLQAGKEKVKYINVVTWFKQVSAREVCPCLRIKPHSPVVFNGPSWVFYNYSGFVH